MHSWEAKEAESAADGVKHKPKVHNSDSISHRIDIKRDVA